MAQMAHRFQDEFRGTRLITGQGGGRRTRQKSHRVMTNAIYQTEFKASKRTASHDLDDLVSKGVLERVGITGRSIFYLMARKQATKGPKEP